MFYFNNWVVLLFKYKEIIFEFMLGWIDFFKFSVNFYKKKFIKNFIYNKMGKKKRLFF